MHEPLTTELVVDVLRDLMAAFPGKRDANQIQRLADVYRNGLQGLSGSALRWAAKTSIQEDEFFPKVARLRELGTRWTKNNTSPVFEANAAPQTHCRCGRAFEFPKRWRPRNLSSTYGKDYGPVVTSADGVWVMLEEYRRGICPTCHPRCEYQPAIDAPTKEPAMRILTLDGGINVPVITWLRARWANRNVAAPTRREPVAAADSEAA